MPFNPDEYLKASAKPAFDPDAYLAGGPSELESAGRGYAQGLSFGLADEAVGFQDATTKDTVVEKVPEAIRRMPLATLPSAAVGVAQKLYEVATTDKTFAETLDKMGIDYKAGRDESRANNEAAKEANPLSYGGSEVVGGIASSAIPIFNVAKGASPIKSVGSAAAQGGLYSAGASEADLTEGEFNEFIEDVENGALTSGLFGAGAKKFGDVASDAATWVGEKTKPVLTKFGKIFANVDEADAVDYLNRADEVNASTSTIEDLKTTVDKTLSEIDGQKELATKNLDTATDNLERGIKDQKDATGRALQTAKEDFERGLRYKDSSKLRGGISKGMEKLQEKVTAESTKAFEILKKLPDDVRVVTGSAIASLKTDLASLDIDGAGPAGVSAKKSAKLIKDQIDELEKFGGELSPVGAKKVLQQLDADDIFSSQKGEHLPDADAAKARARHLINQALGEKSLDYKTQMQVVQADTRLIKKLSSGYGDDDQLFARLGNLQGDKGRNVEQARLAALQNRTGVDFKAELADYLDAKFKLKDPQARRLAAEALPEQVPYKAALQAGTPQARQAAADALPEQQAYQAALEAAEEIRGWSHMNSEARLKALMGNRNNLENKRVLEVISGKSGRDIGQELKDIRTREAFNKSDANGSRKTLMGNIAGKAIQSAIGGAVGYGASGGSEYGGLVGAGAGFGADRYSGQIFKGMLNAYLKGGPAVSALSAKLGPYSTLLENAARRGATAFMATTELLMSKDPEFKARVDGLGDAE